MPRNGHRLGYLIIESERTDGLSTRKLLLESAKHNVVTAYSGKEGVEMYKRFPNVDAVCIEAELPDLKSSAVADSIRKLNPKVRIIGLSPRLAALCKWAEQTIDSHDPNALLEMLEKWADARIFSLLRIANCGQSIISSGNVQFQSVFQWTGRLGAMIASMTR